MSVKTGGKNKCTQSGSGAVYSNKRHINGQPKGSEHRIEVRESLARGYRRWARVNLELAHIVSAPKTTSLFQQKVRRRVIRIAKTRRNILRRFKPRGRVRARRNTARIDSSERYRE